MKKLASIQTKLLAVIIFTTSCALLVAGVSKFLYDINALRESDMATLIELLAYSTTPAQQFRDQEIAREALRLLDVRPTVSAAAIYDASRLGGNIEVVSS